MPSDTVVVNGILEDVVSWIAYLVNVMKDWIGSLVSGAVSWMTGLMKALAEYVAGLFVTLRTYLADLFASIVGWLKSLIEPIVQWLQAAWKAIYDLTVSAIQAIAVYVADVMAWIRGVGETIISTVVSWIGKATEAIAGVVNAAINGVVALVAEAKAVLLAFVSGIASQVASIINGIVSLLNAAWAALVTGANALIDSIGKKLVELRTAFADAATAVVEGIAGTAEETVGPLRDAVKDFTAFIMPSVDPERLAGMYKVFEGTRTSVSQMEVFRQWWADGFRDLSKRSGLYQTVFFFLFTVLSLIPSVWGIGQIFTKVSLQEWNARYPSELLPAADAAAAYRRGLLTEEGAIEVIQRQGYTKADAVKILRITETVPAPADLGAMYLRGIIETNGLEDALKVQGWTALWAQRFRQALEIIPPVQDLITMGVRDVWSPEARALGKLEESFPRELGEWTKKQGLSPEWALRYWAAHWSLPSPQQGFEMLHRRVISPEQLQVLLQALDIAPGWREPMTAIAYSPYTRVDIRRMHALKLITDAEVYEAHLDIGYDEDKAKKLTDFVLSLNRTSVTEEDVELGKLSRSAIVGFYSDGVISRQTATKLLQDMGLTLEAAELYLAAVDMEDERAERKAQTDLIIAQAEAGILTFAEAQDKLRGLGLETVEVDKAIVRLVRAQEAKVKLPTRAEGEGFYVKGYIQRTDYDDLLSRLGFAQKWRTVYLMDAEAKKNAGA